MDSYGHGACEQCESCYDCMFQDGGNVEDCEVVRRWDHEHGLI